MKKKYPYQRGYKNSESIKLINEKSSGWTLGGTFLADSIMSGLLFTDGQLHFIKVEPIGGDVNGSR